MVAVTAMGAAACGDNDDDSAASFDEAAEEPADVGIAGDVVSEEGSIGSDSEAPAATTPATGGSAPTGLPLDETFGRELIVEADLTMTTSDVQQTLDDVRFSTRANGGRVYRADVSIGEVLDDGSVTGGGTLEIKIPPAQLDALIEDLEGVARISNVGQDTQDVTERLIDLEIRIRQARTGIEQIEVLYAQATEFADLVEIERELARRQIELEELLAAERGVERQVDLATLRITIEYEPPPAAEAVEEEPEEEPAEDRGIADAFRTGWDAFAGVMFSVGFVLAVAAPFLVLGLAVLVVSWLVTRVWNRRYRLPAARPTTEPGRPDTVGADEELVGTGHDG